jgi:hypothetical protein
MRTFTQQALRGIHRAEVAFFACFALLVFTSRVAQQYRLMERASSNCSNNVVVFDVSRLGLNNQLYDIAVGLAYACENCLLAAFHDVTLDFATQKKGKLHHFLDVKSTNERLRCSKIIEFESGTDDQNMTKCFGNGRCKVVSMHADIWALAQGWKHPRREEFLAYLVLKDSASSLFRFDTQALVNLPSHYYGVHLKLEYDGILAYCTGHAQYHNILYSMNDSSRNKVIADLASSQYVLEHITCKLNKLYRSIAHDFLNISLPLVVASGLGKADLRNIEFEWILEQFAMEMGRSGRLVFLARSNDHDREMNALADMNVMLKAFHFIGFEASTFTDNINLMRKGLRSTVINWSPICDCQSPWYKAASALDREMVGLHAGRFKML